MDLIYIVARIQAQRTHVIEVVDHLDVDDLQYSMTYYEVVVIRVFSFCEWKRGYLVKFLRLYYRRKKKVELFPPFF